MLLAPHRPVLANAAEQPLLLPPLWHLRLPGLCAGLLPGLLLELLPGPILGLLRGLPLVVLARERQCQLRRGGLQPLP